MFNKQVLLFDESAAGGAAAAQGQANQGNQAQSNQAQKSSDLTFEKWIDTQDENVKGLLDVHTKSLKNALDTERETRKTFEKQIKELAAKAEKGSDAEKRLGDLSAQLELSERRASFAEDAQREGVSNAKALFTLATAGEYFDKKGNANFTALKSEYPEFFTKPLPKGNAGSGTNKDKKPGNEVNDFIRSAAGRG